MNAIYVQIIAAKGSTPRDVGTAMKVTADGIEGTIGGGALEYQAVDQARLILARDLPDTSRKFALGPNLGQCCGGAVTLTFSRQERPVDPVPSQMHLLRPGGPHPLHLWLWGAGHVGRAVVAACHPQQFKITWVDTAMDRFPQSIPADVTAIPAADPAVLAARAPTYAHHLIFTYSHDIDFALCAALLKRGAAFVGLIGSDTKWARFSKRLKVLGLDPGPIICPIGDKSLGKTPDAIARGTVAALLDQPHRKASA